MILNINLFMDSVIKSIYTEMHVRQVKELLALLRHSYIFGWEGISHLWSFGVLKLTGSSGCRREERKGCFPSHHKFTSNWGKTGVRPFNTELAVEHSLNLWLLKRRLIVLYAYILDVFYMWKLCDCVSQWLQCSFILSYFSTGMSHRSFSRLPRFLSPLHIFLFLVPPGLGLPRLLSWWGLLPEGG